MRIALVAPIFEPVPPARHGGTERSVALLCDALARRGHDVTLFASGDSQVSVPLVAPIARALRSGESPSDPAAATLAHLAEAYARASAFDVIHNHAGPLAFPFARSSPTPTLTTAYDRLDRAEVRRAFEAFPEQPLVATSWAQRQALPGSDWRATIHGAVDLRQFSFRGEPGDYLVYVGRVGPEKRLDWAIDLAGEVGRRLVIAGWVAPEDEAYFDHVLAPRIRRAPHVEDLAEIDDWEKDALLGGAYAFVYPADDPGASGLPLLEAMATGTPVVALEASPASELVRDGVTGFVCHSLGDMLTALDEVGDLDRKASRTHVARRFSPAAMARAYEQVYARLVAAAPGSGQPGVRPLGAIGSPAGLAEADGVTLDGATAAPPGLSRRTLQAVSESLPASHPGVMLAVQTLGDGSRPGGLEMQTYCATLADARAGQPIRSSSGPMAAASPDASRALPHNLGELILETAPAYGDAVAFQVRRGFRVQRVTFRQAAERARKVAGWLLARGLVPGDRVAVWSPNMPEYAVLYFGAWLAGLAVVPIDVRTPQDVLHRFVAAAQPRLGFKSRDLEGSFGPPVEATHTLEELFDLVEHTAPLVPLPRVGADHLAEIAYTSGTTGVPKGTLLTHANLLAEVAALRAIFPLERDYRALSVLPLSHILELTITLLLAFTSGVRVTYVPRLNPATLSRALREERITCLVVVPELLRLMLAGMEHRARQEGHWARWRLAHRLAGHLPFPLRRLLFRPVHQALGGQLRFFGVGGAPLDRKLAEAWERMGIRVYEGYGLTETSGAATLNSRTARRLGSVGRPLPGVEIKIGQDDEVMLRGPTVTQGYHNNAELNVEAFADGWFRTGDTGSMDPDGFLHLRGRQAFKIVPPSGRNVYAEDVERVLNQHPLVRESCVVGVERERGEQVHAVLLTEQPDRANEIVRDANQQLAPHQRIRSHSLWTEEDFPRTATLKIDRAQVRQAVARQASTATAERPAGPG